nr:flagellar hook-associated protein FlgK [Sporolactobacillus mangiferae]
MMQRALQVTQTSIQTTGHNISNANTDGYSRQRVNLATWLPYPSIGINAARGAGQIGTGVIDESITRIRDQFVDLQVRDNTNLNGYWSTISDAYSQMEDIINEPTDTGISATLDDFWSALQDLGSDTDSTGTVVLQKGAALADTFNYISQSLGKVQDNLNSQITENVDLVNQYADQINTLNQEIEKQEANGELPNDLYDKRDALVDKLSEIVNVKVSTDKSGGNPSKLAEGKYSIEIVNGDGASYDPPAQLVDGANLTTTHLDDPEITGADTTSPSVTISMAGQSLTGFSGKLQGLVDAYTTDYPSVLKSLDNMASTLAAEFNNAYATTEGSVSSGITEFFQGEGGSVTAANIHVNEDLTGNDITANKNGSPTGDNSGATAMADVIASNTYDVDGNGDDPVTLKKYLESLVGQIGVNAQSANQFKSNSETTLEAAQNRRMSVSGVSTDEELTNLIQFQHTYSASARVVTTLDSLLDTLINKMGS